MLFVYPLNKSEMVYCNVEVRFHTKIVLLAIIIHIALLINYRWNRQNAFWNFRQVFIA